MPAAPVAGVEVVMRLMLAVLLLLSACTSAPHYREVPITPDQSIYGGQIEDLNRRLCLERGGAWLEQVNRCTEKL